jgi:hypothetical protein
MTKDEALRLALEALDSVLANHKGAPVLPWIEARDAVKATLEAKDDGITLTTIRHPRGNPALGDLNPESLETMEIDVPVPVQVSPLEFVEMVMEKEHLIGNPIFWAEWPNKENT